MKSLRVIIFKIFSMKALNTSVVLVSCRYQMHKKKLYSMDLKFLLLFKRFRTLCNFKLLLCLFKSRF